MGDWDLALNEEREPPLRASGDTSKPLLLQTREDLSSFTRNVTFARSDAQVMAEWTKLTKGHNRKAREKEVRRFAKWLMEFRLSLRDFTANHLREYLEFLQSPPPHWVGPSLPFLTKDGRHNPKWRPLAGPLHGRTLEQAKTVLNVLFGYLAKIQWIPINHFEYLAKESFSTISGHTTRVTSIKTMEYLNREFFERWAPSSQFEIERKQRARFLLRTLSETGMRREELAKARMCDVIPLSGNWFIKTIGKGSKEGMVAVPASYISALAEYRSYFGLHPSIPTRNSLEPLIFKLKGGFGHLTPEGLYKELNYILRLASQLTDNQDIALELGVLSTHWFRHGYATKLVKAGVPLSVIQGQLRHADPKTTAMYARVDLEQAAQMVDKVFGGE